MATDGPRTLKINMGYFWNVFLPILAFFIFGAILIMVMKWPDDSLEILANNVRNVGTK
jgi:hypothetical protein